MGDYTIQTIKKDGIIKSHFYYQGLPARELIPPYNKIKDVHELILKESKLKELTITTNL